MAITTSASASDRHTVWQDSLLAGHWSLEAGLAQEMEEGLALLRMRIRYGMDFWFQICAHIKKLLWNKKGNVGLALEYYNKALIWWLQCTCSLMLSICHPYVPFYVLCTYLSNFQHKILASLFSGGHSKAYTHHSQYHNKPAIEIWLW